VCTWESEPCWCAVRPCFMLVLNHGLTCRLRFGGLLGKGSLRRLLESVTSHV